MFLSLSLSLSLRLRLPLSFKTNLSHQGPQHNTAQHSTAQHAAATTTRIAPRVSSQELPLPSSSSSCTFLLLSTHLHIYPLIPHATPQLSPSPPSIHRRIQLKMPAKSVQKRSLPEPAPGEKPSLCQKCDMQFMTWDLLHEHKLSSPNHITCKICSMDFTTKGACERHRLQVSSPSPSPSPSTPLQFPLPLLSYST